MNVSSKDKITVTKTESNRMREASYLVKRFGKLAGAVDKITPDDIKQIAACE